MKADKVTMNDFYHDGSNHLACPKCGLCLPCGDCTKYGCGSGGTGIKVDEWRCEMQRYDLDESKGYPIATIIPDPEGDYVLYSDAKAIEEERDRALQAFAIVNAREERMKAEFDAYRAGNYDPAESIRLNSEIVSLKAELAERDRLKAEKEQLKKMMSGFDMQVWELLKAENKRQAEEIKIYREALENLVKLAKSVENDRKHGADMNIVPKYVVRIAQAALTKTEV